MSRIAHLSTLHPPRDNRIFNKECVSLAARGEDVWFVGAQDGDGDDRGVKVLGIGKATGLVQRLVRAQWRAWRALTTIKPDLVHVHDPELIPLVWLWKTLHRKRAIYDAHENLLGQMDDKPWIPKPLQPLARAYAKLLVTWADKGFDGIVTATPFIKTLYSNANTEVVHNYPYLADYPQTDTAHVLGSVVYVGMLSSGRQVDVMIEAVRQVEGATLTLAGKADADVEALLTDPCVNYLGMRPAGDVPQIVGSGQVGLVFLKPLKNYVDSLPTKLFEYMAAGIPAVVTNFEWLIGLLDDVGCCVFVDTTSPDAPAEAIASLMSDPARCEEMGRLGRRAIEERFNFEAEVATLVAVTERALA